jgi:uncharacterized OsmC-like protein
MLGTLVGVLEARGIELDDGAVSATVEGINVIRDRIPVLTRIHVSYSIRVSAEAREVVDRALERHQSKCPTANTLEGAVDVEWSAEIEET